MSRGEIERRDALASSLQRYRVLRPNELLKNSWLLTLPYASRNTIYVAGICRCGTNSFFYASAQKSFEPKYICTRCGNDSFIDVSDVINIRSNSYWFDLSWSTETYIEYDRYIAKAYLFIPFFSNATKSIEFRKEILLSCKITTQGSLELSGKTKNISDARIFRDGRFVDMAELVNSDVYRAISKLLRDNQPKGIEFVFEHKEADRFTPKEIVDASLFFLEHRVFKEIDFCFWEKGIFRFIGYKATVTEMLDSIVPHHSGAVKKELYKSYQSVFEDGYSSNTYDPSSEYLFARVFEDSNHLLTLLKVPYEKRVALINIKNLSNTLTLFEIIKERFTQKQIKELFLGLFDTSSFDLFMQKVELFNDTLNMLNSATFIAHLSQNYPKHRLNMQQLHNCVVDEANKHRGEAVNSFFNYDKKTLRLEGSYKGLSFRLPKHAVELARWGSALHNCLNGYCFRVHDAESIILGVYKEDMICYAIHISPYGYTIKEAKSKYNKIVPSKDMEIVSGWIELKKGAKNR